VRRAIRMLSSVLIVAGALMLLDAGLTVVWQEPVSAVYGRINQGKLDGDLKQLETAKLPPLERRALQALPDPKRRLAFLARSLKRRAKDGQAVAKVRIPKIGANYVVVDGTDADDLRKGPGLYPQTPFPGAGGTTAIAGHRTTYGAPFRLQIVKPTALWVINRVSYDRLVLSACHPLYSAAKRIIVFARLTDAQPRGTATAAT
jgi:sortase A